ncbi:hypothetical protein MNBD_GAMMA23-835 [hydrothermal vent metagenome]|uniref:Uncharacterized protein n=1 Tax=hydrothermal vent metagenome TaxID=652676 RepID=A0A3B0ZYP8_9ZZZZ
MQLPQKQIYLIIPLFLLVANTFAAVSVTKNPSTQLKSWVLKEGGFKLELIQRLPDQTRAFFQGRGFSSKIANDLALSCIFQAIGTNIGTPKQKHAESVSYSLKDWKIKMGDKIQTVKSKEIWKTQWSPSAVNTAAKIAFTWATFPTQQTFSSSSDYGWGMISFGFPPKTTFDLKVVWKQNNKTNSRWVRAIMCPPDR